MLFCKLDESGNAISYGVSWENIKLLKPGVSLPYPPSAELLSELGYGVLEEGEQPTDYGPLEKVQPALPKKVGDVYVKQYAIVPMEGVEREQKIANAWRNLRNRRNTLLQACDKYMLEDLKATMTEEQINNWKIYRQALRDLPSQTDDPFSITWPTKPTE